MKRTDQTEGWLRAASAFSMKIPLSYAALFCLDQM